jgi:hypothetical protein
LQQSTWTLQELVGRHDVKSSRALRLGFFKGITACVYDGRSDGKSVAVGAPASGHDRVAALAASIDRAAR